MVGRSLVMAVAALVAAGLPGPSQATETLRINTLLFGASSAVKAVREVFVPEVKKRTEGRYEVQFFINGELGGQNETLQGVRDGSIFGTILSTAWFSSFVPKLGVASLPFLWKDRETAFRVFDGPRGKELEDELAKAGFDTLGWMELGFRHLTNAERPVHTPDDVKGLKIRLQADPVHMETFRLLGANPVQIAGPELFASLRQGVVDGQENPLVIISMMKMYEAKQKYVTKTGHFFDMFVFAGSKAALDAMSAEDRAAIEAAAAETTKRQRELAVEDDRLGLADLEKHGVEVIELTPEQRKAFQDATAPMYEKIRKDLGEAFVDRFLATVREN